MTCRMRTAVTCFHTERAPRRRAPPIMTPSPDLAFGHSSSPRGRGDADGAPSAGAGAFSAPARLRVPASGGAGTGWVLDALADLVEKSLVVADFGARGRARYRLT